MASGVCEDSAPFVPNLIGFGHELTWRPTKFVKSLQNVHSCSICSVVPNLVYLLPCCHAFCKFCHDAILNSGRVCPVDGDRFDAADVKPVETLESQLLEQSVRCWNVDHGCDFVGTLNDVVAHFYEDCAFHQVRCARCQDSVPRRDVFAHYKEGCDARKRLVQSAKDTRSVNEIWDWLSKLADTQRSMQESFNHLTAMVGKDLRDLEVAVSGQIRELALVRVNHDEFARFCSTTFQDMRRSLSGVGGLIRHQDWLKTTFSSVLQESDDKVYWSVDNIAYRGQCALYDGKVVAASDRFSIANYSARLRFTLLKRSDDVVVAIHLSLCPGPKDDELSWPFVIPFTLSLVHPKDVSKSSQKKVDPLDSRFGDCFLRPIVSENAGVGGSCFTTGSLLDGFVVNDAVLVCVELTR